MLEQVLRHLNNWFLVDIHEGTFTVEDGSITLPFLLTNQYFRICGSVFNDRLHQYPAVDLTDEVFTGTVWALAVPKAVVSLSEDIDAWQEKNGEAVLSPYTSESFGGYSYTKASGGTGGTSAITGWQDAFRGRLNDWRRIGGI
jgi:hypothetical protein